MNKFFKKTSCSTPELEDILHGSKFFSKLDLRDAHMQIPLDGHLRKATTMNTPFGLFQYNLLPFGFTFFSALFQNVMNTTISDLSNVFPFRMASLYIYSRRNYMSIFYAYCLNDFVTIMLLLNLISVYFIL